MKKLIFILLLLPTMSQAQQCYSKKDEFTGKDVKVGTTHLIRFSLSGPALSFTSVGSDMSIVFSFNVDLKPESFDTQKMLFMVKFANGEIKKISANKNTRVLPQTNNLIVAFQGDITTTDITYFQQNPIASIRLCYTGDEAVGYTIEISKGNSERIIKSINCII